MLSRIKPRYAVAVLSLATALAINLTALVIRANAQPGPNRAGLVVQYGNGQVVSRCVTFTEPQITGYDLLKRAQLPLVVDIQGGGTVCKIGNSGCNFPAQQCFCDCQVLNQSCVYWIYYIQSGGAWKYSTMGMLGTSVRNGSVNGWVYGQGSGSSSTTTPPLLTLDQICGSTAPQAPATSIASLTPGQPPATAPTSSPATAAAPTTPARTAIETPAAILAASPTAPVSYPTAVATDTAMPAVTPSPSIPATSTQPPAVAHTPTPAATPAAQPGNSGSSTAGYVMFGVISVGLVVLLLITRHNARKAKP